MITNVNIKKTKYTKLIVTLERYGAYIHLIDEPNTSDHVMISLGDLEIFGQHCYERALINFRNELNWAIDKALKEAKDDLA